MMKRSEQVFLGMAMQSFVLAAMMKLGIISPLTAQQLAVLGMIFLFWSLFFVALHRKKQ